MSKLLMIWAPGALALTALIAVWHFRFKDHSARKTCGLAALLWLMSCVVTLAPLFVTGALPTRYADFQWRQHLGYAGGAAIALALPFIAVTLVLLIGTAHRRAKYAVLATARVIAIASMLMLPTLLFTGWVYSCVLLGYSGCL